MVDSNIVPTLLIYEKTEYIPVNKQSDVKVILEDEEWLMMYIAAQEAESNINMMLNDEDLIQ